MDFVKWSWVERNSGSRQPRWALDEAVHRKCLRLRCCELTRPGDTVVQVGCTRTISSKLCSEEGRKSEVAVPWHPSGGINYLVNVGSDENSSRECLPRSSEERLVCLPIGLEKG
jgi:hypothetical protein